MTSYYTPLHWGKTLIGGIGPTVPMGIIDPAVGDGCLLLCGAGLFPDSFLFGVDNDPNAVVKAKTALPDAVVSQGDALARSSLARSAVWRHRKKIDTVVMNPPFCGHRRSYRVDALGESVTCSIAGAHLLASVEHFTPKTVAAIMPCSFFHSDRDRHALVAMYRAYEVMRAGDLRRSAFARGRASSEIVYFRRRSVVPVSAATSQCSDALIDPDRRAIEVYLVRGGMPVHIAAKSRSPSGLPLVHTKDLAHSSGFRFLVEPSHRGIVVGVAILVPRVGIPKPEHLRVREISSPVQLSDCVVAL